MVAERHVTHLRRFGPWLVGVSLLVVILWRVPFSAFSSAIRHGPHLQLACVDLVMTFVVLWTDSLATWTGLVAVRLRRPFWEVVLMRGATSALFVINYAVGQGAFGYYLHKTGVKPLRATGATLFLIGTNLAALLVLTTVTWGMTRTETSRSFVWSLAIGCTMFALYLVAIGARPRFILRREIFSPLFDAGLRGHGLAMLGRLPHVIMIVLAQWMALRAWDLPVPFVAGVLLVPIVILATVLPISPAGLGTMQAAFVYFFSGFAPGATEVTRTGNIIAFGIVHLVYSVAASILVGLVCLRLANRRGLLSAAV